MSTVDSMDKCIYDKETDIITEMMKKIDIDDDTMNCDLLMRIFNQTENKDIMQRCYFEFMKISKKFPPQKNENKFIYGKLGELALINTLKELNIKNLIDLDKNHNIGSEYKNDIQIDNTKFSVKLKLNKSDIVMVNCKSKKEHSIDVNTILVIINERKLYVIPKLSSFVNTEEYIKKDAGSISYKSKLITYIENNKREFIYIFPQLSEEQRIEIQNVKEIDIYNKLYESYIKS